MMEEDNYNNDISAYLRKQFLHYEAAEDLHSSFTTVNDKRGATGVSWVSGGVTEQDYKVPDDTSFLRQFIFK